MFIFYLKYLMTPFIPSSSSTPPTSLSHMARMMDSLILDSLSPFGYTKITTTSRPSRNASLKKGSEGGHSSTAERHRPINNLGSNAPGGLGIGGSVPLRSKQRLPTQG